MWQQIDRTFKEINKYHKMICIEDVSAIIIYKDMDSYIVRFCIDGIEYDSDYFNTEEEVKFRKEIMTNREKYEVELSADEMFEELGYKKEFSDRNGCNYYHKEKNRSGVKSEHIIHVLSNESSTLYGKYERLDDKEFAANISVAEDKAIHKKIEELKNEQKRNRE